MSARHDPTLQQVVEALGPETVRLGTPGLADVPVTGPRLWDAHDVSGLAPGDVVLGINADPAELLAQAAAAHVAAVALKGDAAPLAEEAEHHGVALVEVAPDVRWDQLLALLQQAVDSLRAGSAEGAPLGDLFAFANALAALVGGAVAVEDPRGALLAYSNLDQPIDEARRQTILGRGNPQSWTDLLAAEGYARQLAHSSAPIRINDPEGRASERVAALVRAGHEVLGSLWVVAGDGPLRSDAEQLVADALPMAALHLLRQRTSQDTSREQRAHQFRALLRGEAVDVESLGIGGDCQVVALAVLDAPDEAVAAVATARIADAVTLAGEAFRKRVVCAVLDSTVYALFPDVRAAGADRLQRLVDDVCRRGGEGLGLRVVAGLSDVRPGDQWATAREQADLVVQVLRGRDDLVVATLDDVRIDSILLTLRELLRDRDDLRFPGIARLVQHDTDHGKQYVETLRAYLQSSGSIPAAAAALRLHPNTMRYRLARLEEIAGLRLDDPDHRLVAAIALLS